ncbi:MAG: MFS transporter [Bacteroidia bacterium]|nr:MFS transporter [Bacteroidia bacterium]
MTQTNSNSRPPIVTIFFTAFIDLLGLSLVFPILGELITDSNYVLTETVSDQSRNLIYGLLSAVFPFAQFFGTSLFGSLSDKIGRKPVLLGTLSISLLGYMIFTYGVYSANLALMFGGRAIQGLGAGNLSILFSSVADISKNEDKAANFGLIGAAFGLGFVIGPFVGGILSDPSWLAQFGWENAWFAQYMKFETPFILGAGLVLVNILQVMSFFKESLASPNSGLKVTPFTGLNNLLKAINNKELRAIFSIVFLQTFGFTFFTTMMQVFLIKKFGMNRGSIGPLFGYIGLIIVFSQGVLVRYFSKRVAPQRMVPIALIGQSFALLIPLLAQEVWHLYLVFPLIAVFQALVQPNISAMVSNMAPPQLQGETLGMQQSVQAMAQVIPPLAGGLIVSWSLSSPMWLAAATIFIAWTTFQIDTRQGKLA